MPELEPVDIDEVRRLALLNVRNTVCEPVTALMLIGTVVQDCQPPVLATARLATAGLVRESSRISTSPLTPAGAPDATRTRNWVAAVVPKSMLLYWSQLPLTIDVTSRPPPVSDVVSFVVPN